MSRRLSPAQEDALRFVRAHGGRLVRLPGGFWTYPGCDTMPRTGWPSEYVRTNTVRALVRLGEVVETDVRTTRAVSGQPRTFCVEIALPTREES